MPNTVSDKENMISTVSRSLFRGVCIG